LTIRVGCCGNAGMSLREYSCHFELMELQSTFYRLPRASTAKGWREAVGKGFEFTMKAFQGVTHPRSSPTWRRAGGQAPGEGVEVGHFALNDFTLKAWNETMEVAELLGVGYVVVQLPPSFVYGEENMRRMGSFFSRVSFRCRPVVEFRHTSWFSRMDEVASHLRELGTWVVTDPLKGQRVRQDVQYCRLHGMGGLVNYRHRYSDRELARLLEELEGQDAYVLFNNLSMKEDALRFKALCGAREKAPPQGSREG